MIKYNIGYYLIMSIVLFILIAIIGFLLKKFIFKNLIEEEDKEFKDEN